MCRLIINDRVTLCVFVAFRLGITIATATDFLDKRCPSSNFLTVWVFDIDGVLLHQFPTELVVGVPHSLYLYRCQGLGPTDGNDILIFRS